MESQEYIAKYWKVEDNLTVQCLLCPHNCKIMNNRYGICRVRVNHSGVLYATTFGRVMSYAYDPIEKKPLNHFYPGYTIFSIGTTGCNFDCSFCQNHELVHYDHYIPHITDEEIIKLASSNGSIGLAYTYNEPLVGYEYVLHLAKKIHALGLKNVLVTNGFINEEPLLELLPYIDAVNIDLKAMTEPFYHDICKGKLHPVLKTIEICNKHTHVEVTTLLIDTLNTSLDELTELFVFIANINENIPIHLSRYFPTYKMDLPKTKLETLAKARNLAKKYLTSVYVGNCFIDDYWEESFDS